MDHYNFVPVEWTDLPDVLPASIRSSVEITTQLRGHLRNANTYFLALQVALIAVIFPIAISLVTLISQRSHASSANAHIQIYYREARALPIGASGIALAAVLSLQIFLALPIQNSTLQLNAERMTREMGLSVLSISWLVINTFAIWHFLAVSLRFVDPSGRERIRERFTANQALPVHLQLDLFMAGYSNAGRLLLSESEKDDSPKVVVGFFGKWMGDVEITKRVHRDGTLVDVWGRPLQTMLRRWWRRSPSQPRGRQAFGREPQPTLGFPALPDAAAHGEVVILRKRGGPKFSRFDRLVIRSCFRFGRRRATQPPEPKAVLDELADEVLGHMERLAVIGFDDSIGAMVKYHTFLIDAYATRGEGDRPASFAEIGGTWGPQHRDWIDTYYRVIERAARLLDQEDQFMRTIVHLPSRLLPGDLTHAAPRVVTGLLDLSRFTVARLEDWVVEHSSSTEQPRSTPPAALNLSGVDSRRYAEVLRYVVGAWESVVSRTGSYFRWEDAPEDPSQQWDSFRVAWPFLWHHLISTAYFVAISIWNGDRAGVEHYLDCLLRWPDRLENDLTKEYLVSNEFLSPDLLEMEWPAVQAQLARLPSIYLDTLEPQNLFASVLENAWSDVVWIAAAISLGWLADRKTSQDLTTLAITQLKAGEAVQDQGFYGRRLPATQEHEFERLFQSLVRMELSGPRRSKEGYAARVNGVVQFLDLLSERDVIPGRTFKPTTRHDLYGLRLLFSTLLLMAIDKQSISQIESKISALIDRVEAYFGDHGLSELSSYLDYIGKHIADDGSRKYIEGIYGSIGDLSELDLRCDSLRSLLDKYIREISRRRDDRIKSTPVSSQKMLQIELAAEMALTMNGGGLDILDHFVIRRAKVAIKSEVFRITNANKGYLITPKMADEPTKMVEHMAQLVQRRAADLAWQKALNEPARHRLKASTAEDYFKAFLSEAERLRSAGLRPVLLVRNPADPLWLRYWLRGPDDARPAGMHIGREGASEVGGSGYIITINGVHVFKGSLEVGTSLLFPRELISEVTYGEDEGGRIVHATFGQPEDSSDFWTGYVEFSFRQCVRLHDQAEVIEISYPAEAGYGEDRA